jgi:hypothetical protein
VSKQLEKARAQYQAGQFKKAADTLYEVSFGGTEGASEARGVVELATLLRDAAQGSLRDECEQHIARAQRLLDADAAAATAARAGQLESELTGDPARLARWAKETGLTWLEIESADDVVAADQRAAMLAASAGQAAPAPRCFIDAVEAEGWRLAHVAYSFKPTAVQTSILRGADLLGGDVVQGDEKYLYLFRRVDGTSR